jgi:ATP-binding cassette, subfamily C (CFTR/MRP), member 1
MAAVALNLFSPAITLIMYAIHAQLRGAKSIDVNMAFTSIAIIDIVSTPANRLLGLFVEAASVIAAFDRIQTYLLSPSREDKRVFLERRYANDDSLDRMAMNIDRVTIRPASTASPVLRNISIALKKGNMVVVSGVVGSGKTTLAKALLGDLPPDSGVIQTAHGSIAYCSQVAWLINGTVKEAICGPPGRDSAVDEEWYRRVMHACDLEEDLDQMPNGDQTVIGSRGITLSGGQKQRVVSRRVYQFLRRLLALADLGCNTGPRTSCVRPSKPDYPRRCSVCARRNHGTACCRQPHRTQGFTKRARGHGPTHHSREYVILDASPRHIH